MSYLRHKVLSVIYGEVCFNTSRDNIGKEENKWTPEHVPRWSCNAAGALWRHPREKYRIVERCVTYILE